MRRIRAASSAPAASAAGIAAPAEMVPGGGTEPDAGAPDALASAVASDAAPERGGR